MTELAGLAVLLLADRGSTTNEVLCYYFLAARDMLAG